jgi:hypothetical protein
LTSIRDQRIDPVPTEGEGKPGLTIEYEGQVKQPWKNVNKKNAVALKKRLP